MPAFTLHFCRFRLIGKDKTVKSDTTFRNFAFGAGLELFFAYFTGTAPPEEFYLGLLQAGFGTATFAVGDGPPSASNDWIEVSVNWDGDLHAQPRQQWAPTIQAWTDGDWSGFEVTGSAEWTATKFRYPPDAVPPESSTVFANYFNAGVVCYGDEDFLDIGEPPGTDYAAGNSEPALFGAVTTDVIFLPDVFETGVSGDGIINIGDTISVTFTIRFQIEELNI